MAAIISTQQLSGIVPDQGGGFGYHPARAADRAPDGLALVDAAGPVVQLLSYEGAFRGSSGPAAGLDSTDISVLEPGNTTQDQSVQLQGKGTVYQDFAWVGPTASSYGAPNQQHPGPPPVFRARARPCPYNFGAAAADS